MNILQIRERHTSANLARNAREGELVKKLTVETEDGASVLVAIDRRGEIHFFTVDGMTLGGTTPETFATLSRTFATVGKGFLIAANARYLTVESTHTIAAAIG